ncbi:alpha/beta fold hydrolase [Nonomuraea sp. JJY05]|uniref:alpha/beta fold hydrolase n=1 Tax=Nonomuraea sp. JJY05 TaxID=3350255 RepID=UPI00373E9CD9
MRPDTIVLIHGFWVTPRSWENWVAHYEAKGFRVLAPACPGFEVEVEALNADPTPIEQVTVPQIIDSLEKLVGGLDQPPILMGHSAAASSPRSCSTTATARPASRSTPRPPKASRSSRFPSSAPPSRC